MRAVIVGVAEGILRSAGYAVWAQSAAATGRDVHILSPDEPVAFDGVRWIRTRAMRLPEGARVVQNQRHSLARWAVYARYLRSVGRDYDLVCLADVRDVVFNRDPFGEVEEFSLPGFRGIGACPEPWRASAHPWTREQAERMRAALAEPWEDGMEFNGGCLFGDPVSLHWLAVEMAAACRFAAAAGLSDQAPLNLFLRGRHDVATVPAGVYLHGEGLAKGALKGDWRKLAAVYHQYDRVPEHRAEILRRWPVPRGAVRTQVVISRYCEDVTELLERCAEHAPVVYDKGHGINGGISIQNVGFEAQTWLHHFAEHYDRLPEVTLCLQANPFDHCTADEIAALLALLPESISFEPLGEGRMQFADGRPDHVGLGPVLARMWRELLKAPVPRRWFAWYGGQFAVHRDIVRRRPRKWYRAAAALVKTKEDACALERMWAVIFTP